MELWDIVSVDAATQFSRRVPDEFPDTLQPLLPNRYLQRNKSRRIVTTLKNVVAKYRAYDAPLRIGERPAAVAAEEWILPPLGQILPLTEWEQLQLQLEIANGSPAAVRAVIEQIYDDLTLNTQAVLNRLKLARGQLLTTGKFTLVTSENGLALEADWEVKTSHKPDALNWWSDPANATPVSDELAWNQLLIQDGQGPADWVRTSSQVYNLLGATNQYRQQAYPGAVVSTVPTLTRAQVDDVRARNGLPPIVVEDGALLVDGVTVRLIPARKFIMGRNGIGETQYGISARALQLARRGNNSLTLQTAPGIVSSVWSENNPVTGLTATDAVGMPVLADPDRLIIANVLAP